MTDVLQNALQPADPQTQDPSTLITRTTQAAPELAKQPGAAVSIAANGGNVEGNAQAFAQVQNMAKTSEAARRANAAHPSVVSEVLGFLGHAASSAGGAVLHAGSSLANMANKPLQFVQREYRYLHDVEARHGMGAALIEGLGVAAGAVGGGLLAGPSGAVLGAEGAAGLEGQFAYKDSWDRAGDPNYVDPHTHRPVSMGSDIASALSIRPGTGFYNDVANVANFASSLVLDPVGQTGMLFGAARSAEGAGGLLGKIWGGTKIDPENVERAYQMYPSVRRAFGQIASMDSGEVARRYPQIANAFATRLGEASTPEEVGQVFKEATFEQQMMTDGRLPTMTVTRMPFNALRNAAAKYDGPLADNPLIGPAAWARRFTRLPDAYDPTTQKFGSEFNFHDDSGAVGINRLAMYGHNARVADDLTTMYLEADVPQRIVMYRNLTMDTLMNMAGFAHSGEIGALSQTPEEEVQALSEIFHPDTASALKEWLDHLTGGGDVLHSGHYGMTTDGKVIPPVIRKAVDDTGESLKLRQQAENQAEETPVTSDAALLPSQMRKGVFPDFKQVVNMAANLSGARNYFGRVDDFAYRHLTQPFFKRLVLMSGSYALHISISEMIPNALRLGLVKLAKARYVATVTKLGYEEHDNRALDAFTGWLYRVAPGKRLLGRDMDYAAEFYVQHDGHMVSQGGAAGENYSKELDKVENDADTLRKTIFNMPTKERTSSDFALFGPEQPRFADAWNEWLREVGRDPASSQVAQVLRDAAAHGASQQDAIREATRIAKEQIESLPDNVLNGMERSRYFTMEHPPPGMTPIDNWASDIVENVRAATTSAEGEVHVPLLDHVANGTVPGPEDLKTYAGPAQVKGRNYVPVADGRIERIANFGFRKALNPIVNYLSREPIGLATYLEKRKALEDAVENGWYSEDEAAVVAAGQTDQEVIRFVHNLHDRTQWSSTLRNWAPFYFAQEQAWRRMGRLFAENPGKFRQYQLAIAAVGNTTASQQTGSGTYTVMPGTGFLVGGTIDALKAMHVNVYGINAGMALGGALTSSAVMFPLSTNQRPGLGALGYLAPDIGPVVAIPAKAAYSLFPEFAKSKNPEVAAGAQALMQADQNLVGDVTINAPMWEQLVPNTFVQRAINDFAGDDRAFQSAFLHALQNLAYQQQVAMDKWEKGGRKGPMPQIVPDQQTAFGNPGAMQAFVDRVKNQTRIAFGLRAVLGMVLPISPQVRINDYGMPEELQRLIAKEGSVTKGMQAFLAKNPDATPWTVYQSKSSTGAPLQDTQAAMGWLNQHQSIVSSYPSAALWLMPQLKDQKFSSAVYNEQLAMGLRVKDTPEEFLAGIYTAASNQVYYNQLLPEHEANIAAAGKNRQAIDAEYTRWNEVLDSFKATNPYWSVSHAGDQQAAMRQQAIQQLTAVFKKGLAPAGPQSDAVAELLGYYQEFEQAYVLANGTYNYQTTQKKIRTAWQDYLGEVTQANPELGPIANSVFKEALQ